MTVSFDCLSLGRIYYDGIVVSQSVYLDLIGIKSAALMRDRRFFQKMQKTEPRLLPIVEP